MKRTARALLVAAAFGAGLAIAAVPNTEYQPDTVLTAQSLNDNFGEIETRLTSLESAPVSVPVAATPVLPTPNSTDDANFTTLATLTIDIKGQRGVSLHMDADAAAAVTGPSTIIMNNDEGGTPKSQSQIVVFRVLRGATLVGAQSMEFWNARYHYIPPSSFRFLDLDAPEGSATYTLQASVGSGTSVTAYKARLVGYEL